MSVEIMTISGAFELSEQELDAVSGGANNGGLPTNLNQYISDTLKEVLKPITIPSFSLPQPDCSCSVKEIDRPIGDGFPQDIVIG